MKKLNLSIIFIIISILWLVFFLVAYIDYRNIQKDLSIIRENISDIENKKYYERTVKNMQLEFENLSRISFTTKSSSEFIAKLPKIGEMAGIDKMSIENMGTIQENQLEITELKIITISQFPEIGNFIDTIERSQLPIQISKLSMIYKDKALQTEMLIRIYKKVIEG